MPSAGCLHSVYSLTASQRAHTLVSQPGEESSPVSGLVPVNKCKVTPRVQNLESSKLKHCTEVKSVSSTYSNTVTCMQSPFKFNISTRQQLCCGSERLYRTHLTLCSDVTDMETDVTPPCALLPTGLLFSFYPLAFGHRFSVFVSVCVCIVFETLNLMHKTFSQLGFTSASTRRFS